MKNKVLKALIVELLIIALVMSDFILLGMNLITYALETVNNATNNENVKFAAYFVTAEGETSHSEYEINSEEMMLYLKVEVDNDGYFDGVVTLKDCNFVIKEKELPKGVKKIDGNVITLNTVRADEPSQEIAVKIKAKIEDNFDFDMLGKNNIINLAGNYYNSTEKVIKINTDKEIKLDLLPPSNIETKLEGEIITNTNQYVVDQTNKRIVQLELNSNIINNLYPIKETSYEMQLPNDVELVNVISKGTYATNGKADRKLEENIDYIWEKDNQLLKITIKNEAIEGKISWKKETKDNVIATLILPNDMDINENEYKVKSKVELYGIEEKVLEKEILYNLKEENNGIIKATIENDTEIYKGKIYSKEEREYNSTTNIEINYSNLIDRTVLEETTSYEVDNQMKTANVQYKTTIVEKSEIERMLGAEGKITIKNELDEVLTEITADTMADEEGNIIITYKEGTKGLKIELTKTVETGIIRLKHTKVIKPDIYEKEEIQSLGYLVENVKLKYDNVKNEINKKVELKETNTLAELTVVPQTLSTVAKNEEVKIALTLRTDNEKFDLYKNPEITIKLPDYIKTFEPVSSTPFYMEEFKIDEFKYINASKEIKLKLIGEQTKYSGINNNPYIEIIANIELEEKTASKQDQITLTYKNEKAIRYENDSENGILVVPINIVGHSGLIAFNSIKNYDISTNSGVSNDENIGNLKMHQNSTEAISEIVLLNNTGEDLSNITVIGNLPVDGEIKLGDYSFENNVGATLKNKLNVLSGTGNIYYTSNPNATENLSNTENGWNANISEVTNPVLYMIAISNMEKGTNFVADYAMNIPADLGYSQDMKTTYVASYEAGGTGGTVTAEPVGLETGSLVPTLEAYVGGNKIEEGSNVKAGEVIRYKITVENTGSSDATDVQVTGLIPEGTVYVEPYEDFIYGVSNNIYYMEDEKKENIIFDIQNIKGGECKSLEYEVRVKSNISQGTAINQVIIKYDNDIELKSNQITNNLQPGSIRMTVKRRTDLQSVLKPSEIVQYFVIVENLTEKEQKNIEVCIDAPKDFEKVSMSSSMMENIEYEEIEKGIKIKQLGGKECQVYLVSYNLLNNIEELIKEEKITATAVSNNEIYRSNAYYEIIYGLDVKIEMSVTREEEYLKTDDTIDYEITIMNNSQIEEKEHSVKINIPEELVIQKVMINEVEEDITNGNYFEKRLNLEKNSTTKIKITAVVNYDPTRDEVKTINTSAKLLYSGMEVQKTEEFMHYIEAAVEKRPEDVFVPEDSEKPEEPKDPDAIERPEDTEKPDDSLVETPDIPESPADPIDPTDPENPEIPDNPDKPDSPDNPINPGETKNKYSISGKAWLDKDKDGAKGIDDEALLGVKVKLLNIKTNQFVRNEAKTKDLIVETDEEGYYIFENIEEGNYLVVFEYDTEWYKTTTFEKEGIVESKNSNVISKKLTINGQEKQYATTNKIQLNKNFENINMGLVFAKRFDVTLEKYITKTIVQTSKETKTYDYKNKEFAKVEITAKKMVGANILVQYTLKLTNTGDVAAYVNSIVDYIPAGFKFNSELNKDWYEAERNLCTNVLEGIAIEPGETKEINLVLTKTKTDGNAELINNMAEINEAYNIYGIADTNSTEGNKNKDENDLGSADFMISIQTGNVISYLVIVIAMLIPIGISVYIMMKKMLLKEEN